MGHPTVRSSGQASHSRQHTAEKNVHRVLEGFRREVTAEERCRRADIEPNKLYSRTEGFMGQASSVRVETWSEPPLYGIDRLEWQSADLKDLVDELSLDLHRLKKTSAPSLDESHIIA